jgi:hypothetical protein
MKFLIQTIEGRVLHDFSFRLIESVRYQNWLRNDNDICYDLTDETTYPNCIPVGSVEFVIKYLDKYFNLKPIPKNIPNELMDIEWTGRNVLNGTEKDITGFKFVKSNTKIKGFAEICDKAPKGEYQISDLIEIDSEWRAFIYNGKLAGLQNYSGRFDLFPNVNRINEMIKAYKSQPAAFTLDVAINSKGTFIIEVHDFFSCALYGFSDHRILPFMFSRWFYNFTRKN